MSIKRTVHSYSQKFLSLISLNLFDIFTRSLTMGYQQFHAPVIEARVTNGDASQYQANGVRICTSLKCATCKRGHQKPNRDRCATGARVSVRDHSIFDDRKQAGNC
ncbi:hypothetical protein AZE42_11329 [Rhizopogon vesiculosus]|uniref:Uncharacterized protein n=1 Tax=Rhizopogon vesiculosus TaxID=180088 RepID=A0A1J8QHB9_9AGAM|nr:hypothetical protein AZE42_11329 [Rhizopogon vesiculosus]